MDSAEAYEIYAQDFLLARDHSDVGLQVVESWSRTLKAGSTIIELACGAGYPVTRILHTAGLKIWAVDSSPSLVSVFKGRFPTIPVQCAKVQSCDFFNLKFDAALAIGIIFLLSESDQIKLISDISHLLNSGSRFLFTAPIEKGEWKDVITGLGCISLGEKIYEKYLSLAGFRVLEKFVDQGSNNYYNVEKLR